MKTYNLILILLVTVVGCLVAGTIPFEPSQGLVTVPVLIDGKIKGTFGVDTGADRLYIDKSFAEKNGIDIMRAANQREIQSVDGSAKAYAASLKKFEIIGSVALTNQKATVVDLRQITGNKGGSLPDGLIGNQILRQYYVSVDYPNHQLELAPEKPDFLKGRKYSEVAFSNYADYILVDVVINDQLTVPMIFDYCATHTVITSDILSELGKSYDKESFTSLESVRIGEVSAGQVLTVINDLELLKKRMPRAKFDGIIGSTFLRNFHITVDFKNKKIYFREE